MRHPCELTLTYVKRPGTDFAVTKTEQKFTKRLVCSTKCNMRYDVLVRVLPFRPLKFFQRMRGNSADFYGQCDRGLTGRSHLRKSRSELDCGSIRHGIYRDFGAVSSLLMLAPGADELPEPVVCALAFVALPWCRCL